MWVYPVGAAAFMLYFLYDINSVLWKKRWVDPFFAVGTLLLFVSTVGCYVPQLLDGTAAICRNGALRVILIPAGIGFVCMFAALFLELPFEKTYVTPREKTPVYDRGMYAMCRHPGVLWFCMLFLSLALGWETAQGWGYGLMCCGLNIAYVFFQDRWTFPQCFDDYGEYQKSTPFLIPTAFSAARAWHTRR